MIPALCVEVWITHSCALTSSSTGLTLTENVRGPEYTAPRFFWPSGEMERLASLLGVWSSLEVSVQEGDYQPRAQLED